MATVRTKRKIIADKHGYEAGRVTSKSGKGYQSMSESYESVKQFCESAFLDGYMLAQREYADKGPAKGDDIPGFDDTNVSDTTKKNVRKATNGETPEPAGSKGSSSGSGSTTSSTSGGGIKGWWNKLTKGEKTAIKAAGITTATALTAAGLYSLLKKHKSKSEDPEVQKAYTFNFIDGYFYAQKEFNKAEEKADEERRDKNWRTAKAIGLSTGIAGLGSAITSNILLGKTEKAVDNELKKGGKNISSDLVKKLRRRSNVNGVLTPVGLAAAAGSATGLYQAYKARKERLEGKGE
jgi:hypothetical protein